EDLSVSGYWRRGNNDEQWRARKKQWRSEVEAEEAAHQPACGAHYQPGDAPAHERPCRRPVRHLARRIDPPEHEPTAEVSNRREGTRRGREGRRTRVRAHARYFFCSDFSLTGWSPEARRRR